MDVTRAIQVMMTVEEADLVRAFARVEGSSTSAWCRVRLCAVMGREVTPAPRGGRRKAPDSVNLNPEAVLESEAT